MILTVKPRRVFNVNDKKDLDVVAKYIKSNGWGKEGCPFALEEPWPSVPAMVKDKIVRKHLNIK